MTWDLVAWAIFGSKFLLSPQFRHFEGTVIGAGSTCLIIGFLRIDRAHEVLKRRQALAFLIALVCVLGAGIPVASLLLLLSKTLSAKGLSVITHPRFIEFTALATLLLACKYRAITQYFRLMRPDVARLLMPDTHRFTVSSAENIP